MKAITRYKYGGPEILQLEDIPAPVINADDQVLIKVKANSVNPADWHLLRGEPFFARFVAGLFKPSNQVPGADFAGIVEAVGKGVTAFKPGDRVFGSKLMGGAFAEYTCASSSAISKMPDNASFLEMAALPIAAITAWQGLVTHGKIQPGESVLVNGASGGVGHFAVQLAKAMGAKVTGVCSARNADFVRSLGADEVIAYDQENIHLHQGRYDLVMDTNGNLDHADYQRMGKRGVSIGFTSMGHMIKVQLSKAFNKFPLVQFTASGNADDYATLARLVSEGKLRPHLEKTYPYTELPEAIRYIEAMRTRGKVVIDWEGV